MNQNQFQFENGNYTYETPAVKNAAYYRKRAREALKNYLGIAIVVGLLFSLLAGGGGGSGVSFTFSPSIFEGDFGTNPDVEQDSIGIIGGAEAPSVTFEAVAGVLLGIVGAILVIVVLIGIVYNLFVASPIRLGYEKFNLELIDGNQSGIRVGTLFSYFRLAYGKSIVLNLLYSLLMTVPAIPTIIAMVCGFVVMALFGEQLVLGVMLFTLIVFVGVVLTIVLSVLFGYRYAFAFTILAEHPEVTPVEALRASANMMRGNKWRLFCLDISFIGWGLLAVYCTCGIGMIFLMPYIYAARMAFYDDISNRQSAKEVEFPSLNPDDYTV